MAAPMTPTIDALPMKEIDRLEGLAEAALGRFYLVVDPNFPALVVSNVDCLIADCSDTTHDGDAVATFIVAACNALPALCAQARRTVTAEAERDKFRRTIALMKAASEASARARPGLLDQAYAREAAAEDRATRAEAEQEQAQNHVAELELERDRLCASLTRAEAEGATLREKVERLEAAIRPYARLARFYEEWPDALMIDIFVIPTTAGDLRRAAALLPTPDAGTGEER